MATVHPSRMRLIPEQLREAHRGDSRTRSPSPRRRSRSPRRTRSRTPDRERERERDRGRDRDRDDKGRTEYRDSDRRRASPQYDDYRRPPPPHMSDNRGGHDNMYPPRQDRGGHITAVPYGSAGADFMESRRLQREASVVDIWPPSPKEPARALSPARKKSSKRSKRRRSVSSDSDSSEEERRRKEKKEKKRAKRKEKEERREKKKHRRSRSRARDSEDDESDDDRRHRTKHRRTRSPERERERDRNRDRDEEDDRRDHRHRHRTRSKSLSRSKSPEQTEGRMDIDRQDKPQHHPSVLASSASKSRQVSSAPSQEDSDDDEVGPQPMYKATGNKKVDERAYGGALLRGEGSAMAAFLQDGTESRIPRRGEIGLTSDEIAKYEDVGYVMSGSRHKRMNAVRMRKENQVISAEEKRGILKLQKEERDRRELILREELLEMMNEKLKSQAISAHIDPPVD
ncbi:ras-induced vulval development antagonist-domain-containing protein [Panaeolus papilionaceus]|nr:ras-induced vulval development antagonist-domain-containing protein [Panaeolus papilionaceus]